MTGSAGVLALVLAEAVAGAATLLFAAPLWSHVRRGFFQLTGAVVVVTAAATWLTATAGVARGDGAGRSAAWLAAATAVATFAWLALLFARRDSWARVVGIASLPIAVATLVAMSLTARQPPPIALAQLLAGAAFLGAVVDGLLLGHWYLTDRRLGRGPINGLTDVLLVAVVLEAAAVVSGGFGAVAGTPEFNPLLTAGALAPWIALGMVGTTALIAVLVRLTLRGERPSAVQAATGFFYLAVITAFTAEVAVKVRFLPS